MEDEFLADNMVIYIEKEITTNFSSDSVIDEFNNPLNICDFFYI